MVYRIILKPSAKKELNKLPEKDQYRVLAIIPTLANNPYSGKKLAGPAKGLYSLRVWPYRIIYEANKQTITIFIIRIGHRQGVYK